MKEEYTIRITLDELLAQQNMTRYELAKCTGIKYQTIDNYYKNKVKRYDNDILLKICLTLKCTIGDVIQIIQKA